MAGAYTSAGQRIGAALESTKDGQSAAKFVENLARFWEGYLVPVSPVSASLPGSFGGIVSRVHDAVKE